MRTINLQTIFLKCMVWLSALFTFLVLLFLISYILVKGVPYITPDLFDWTYNSQNVSMTHAIINTLSMTAVTLLVAVPLGLFTAIYLVEYARGASKIVGIIRVCVQTLAGIPSIVYGLFGMLFFVMALGLRVSLLAGAFTMVIMILPIIIRTGEEALIAVPDSYREACLALGAGKLRTVFRIVLPAAIQGIMAGVILGIGRIVGETAALIYTSGSVAKIAKVGVTCSTFPDCELYSGSGRTLAIHMYALSGEGFHVNEASATAVILLVTVVGINAFSAWVAKKVVK
jgi:phosphate transport system permease protein